MEYNISFAQGLERVANSLAAYNGMWPSVLFAYLALQEEPGFPAKLRILGVHFQASATPAATWSKKTLGDPIVVEGAMTINDFRTLVAAWSDGGPAIIDGQSVQAPQSINTVRWENDAPCAPAYHPFLEELPAFPTTYREARLICSGEQLMGDSRNQLQQRLYELNPDRATPQLFSLDYLKLNWSLDSEYLLIHFPLAVGMRSTYDPNLSDLRIEVHFRPPLTPEDFEIRVGTGRYDASIPPLVPTRAGTDAAGWDLALATTELNAASPIKVWLSRPNVSPNFAWEQTVDLGRAMSPALVRERFVAALHRLGHHPMASSVASRMPGGEAGEGSPQSFEVAVLNALAGAGWSAMFAGSILKTAGIDVVAFDDHEQVHLISATTSNDIAKKLRTLLNVLPQIVPHVESNWQVRPVIITTQALELCIASEIEDCRHHGVRVLGSGDLEPLKEDPPDIQAFIAAFG